MDNCHFPAVWMPHAAVWDHRWLCEPSTLETNNGHLCMFYMILTSCHAWIKWHKFELRFLFRHPLSAAAPSKQWSSLAYISTRCFGEPPHLDIGRLAAWTQHHASLECRIDFVPTCWCASHRVCDHRWLHKPSTRQARNKRIHRVISCMDIMDIEARVRVLSRPQAATQLRRFTKAAQ